MEIHRLFEDDDLPLDDDLEELEEDRDELLPEDRAEEDEERLLVDDEDDRAEEERDEEDLETDDLDEDPIDDPLDERDEEALLLELDGTVARGDGALRLVEDVRGMMIERDDDEPPESLDRGTTTGDRLEGADREPELGASSLPPDSRVTGAGAADRSFR